MVQHYENTSSVDYSLKEGETLVLQLKKVSFHLTYFARRNELDPGDGFFSEGLQNKNIGFSMT
jgi:hypothetical protein